MIAKGTRVLVKHKRTGEWIGIVTEDFDPELTEWYPFASDQDEIIYGTTNCWGRGDMVPARKSLCTFTIIGDNGGEDY